MTRPARIYIPVVLLSLICVLLFSIPPVASRGVRRSTTGRTHPALPRPDHIVIVVMENKSWSEIIGNPEAPYINSLAGRGALFSESYGVTHPSQPNYLALFSGSTQGVRNDSCPHSFTDPNLGSELLGAGLTFGIYSESMPSVGFTGCDYKLYVRKHNPAVNWQGANIPPSSNMRFADFPSDYTLLPTVSIVVPNLENDMHDGSIAAGDAWLRDNMNEYITWAESHNSLFILTWDEGSYLFGFLGGNHIPTVFTGQMVRKGIYDARIDHYNVLRTILDMYGLPLPGKSAEAEPITGVWAGAN